MYQKSKLYKNLYFEKFASFLLTYFGNYFLNFSLILPVARLRRPISLVILLTVLIEFSCMLYI